MFIVNTLEARAPRDFGLRALSNWHRSRTAHR